MDPVKRKVTAPTGADAGKRFKADVTVAPSRFEEELAKLAPDEVVADVQASSQESRWPRPSVPKGLIEVRFS